MTPALTMQLNVRIPADLRARLAAAADRNNRTLNDEVLRRLESSFVENEDRRLLDAIRKIVA